jgi:hypothetical protein
MRQASIALSLALGLATTVLAQAKFTSTWKAPGPLPSSYAGKKVVGLIVSEDMDLRMSTEEALARALTARGAQGVAAYRVIPKEEIHNPESVKAWFQRTGAAGLVVMRLVDLQKETTPSGIVWQSGYYNSLWSYYPYAWTTTIDVVHARTDISVVVETLLFDVPGARLLWAGTSTSTNPKDAQVVVQQIVAAAADQMKKDGLIRGK